jgi:phospholipase C
MMDSIAVRRALPCMALLLAACGGRSLPPSLPTASLDDLTPATSPIKHVVVMIQENRTFNDFFATYPGGDGTTTGKIAQYTTTGCNVKTGTIPLKKQSLIIKDLSHNYQGYAIARDGGKLDAFDKVPFGDATPECTYPYQYTNPADIKPYWDIAQQYALAEHLFTTQGSSSFVAHQDLIRGSSQISTTDAMVNDPSGTPWGCDAPEGTYTSLITKNDQFKPRTGPFPCTKVFPASYKYNSLRDLLDAKKKSWLYYAPPFHVNFGGLMTAYDVIAAVRYGPEWKTNISSPQTNIFKDISAGTLPAMSWVIPDEPESDHPGESVDYGPSWVASVVNAVGGSAYWNSTAIIVVWDDWGGLYDNDPPRQIGFGGLGFRVPALIVSAYARPGYIAKTEYQFGSILRYVEDNFRLGTLHTTDLTSNSLIDCFDYKQKPIIFHKISSTQDERFFLRQKPSNEAIDDDM